MKNYILRIFISVTFLVAVMQSCKKLSDTKPYDRFDDATVWTNKSNAMSFVYGTYSNVLEGLYRDQIGTETWTNNIVATAGNSFTREEITRDNDFGFNRFSIIRRCNIIIEKAASSTTMSEPEKLELQAHGKFLRAMTYYWLARRFGRVIFVDRVLTEDEETYALPSTSSVAETYSLIMKDIDDAIAGLPATAPAGIASKWAAYALKSEASLQAAAYTGDNNYYELALAAADSVILKSGAALEADYESIFNDKKRFSSEIILALYRDKSNTTVDGTDMQLIVPNVSNDAVRRRGATPFFNVDKVFEAWAQYSPTQNMMDAYLAIDQADPTKAVRWDETSQYMANITKRNSVFVDSAVVTGQGSINSIIYNNRDKRLAASIVYDSVQWYGETVTTNTNGNINRMINGSLSTGCCLPVTNSFVRKGVYAVTPRPFVGIPTDYHYVVFRLGRVYLNKAEAQLRLNRISEAVATFNETRVAHGGLPASTANTAEVAWTDYKRERRVEMFFEQDYYWSLLRWGKYGGLANSGIAPGGTIPELEEVPTFMEINHDRNGYRVEVLNWTQNQIRIFDETRRYLLPIQNSQIIRHGGLEQNPNW